ncbi:acyl carrier protein [Actinokineospora pegani]|uniref:acyl carrier protein n=1 Tax=Actinokineospora pegani TaxID=2654637 RepID=UPI0012EA8EC9|nr:acyl carrier protein [Actinokineospora pegani]
MTTVSLDTIADDLRDPSLQLESALEGLDITEATSLTHDLQMDSLALVDFIVFLEGKYDISVADERLASIDTIGDVVALVNDLVAGGESLVNG